MTDELQLFLLHILDKGANCQMTLSKGLEKLASKKQTVRNLNFFLLFAVSFVLSEGHVLAHIRPSSVSLVDRDRLSAELLKNQANFFSYLSQLQALEGGQVNHIHSAELEDILTLSTPAFSNLSNLLETHALLVDTNQKFSRSKTQLKSQSLIPHYSSSKPSLPRKDQPQLSVAPAKVVITSVSTESLISLGSAEQSSQPPVRRSKSRPQLMTHASSDERIERLESENLSFSVTAEDLIIRQPTPPKTQLSAKPFRQRIERSEEAQGIVKSSIIPSKTKLEESEIKVIENRLNIENQGTDFKPNQEARFRSITKEIVSNKLQASKSVPGENSISIAHTFSGLVSLDFLEKDIHFLTPNDSIIHYLRNGSLGSTNEILSLKTIDSENLVEDSNLEILNPQSEIQQIPNSADSEAENQLPIAVNQLMMAEVNQNSASTKTSAPPDLSIQAPHSVEPSRFPSSAESSQIENSAVATPQLSVPEDSPASTPTSEKSSPHQTQEQITPPIPHTRFLRQKPRPESAQQVDENRFAESPFSRENSTLPPIASLTRAIRQLSASPGSTVEILAASQEETLQLDTVESLQLSDPSTNNPFLRGLSSQNLTRTPPQKTETSTLTIATGKLTLPDGTPVSVSLGEAGWQAASVTPSIQPYPNQDPILVAQINLPSNLPSIPPNQLDQLRQSPSIPSPRDLQPSPTPTPTTPDSPEKLPPPDQLLEPPSTPAPSPSETPSEDPSTPGSIPGSITVERFEFEGNTAFKDERLADLLKDYTGKPITFAQLLEARSKVTQLYIDEGYITSGAFIPPQELTGGTVTIRVLEGSLEDINVTGTRRLKPGYVRSRIRVRAKKPLNVPRLLNALRLLQLDPLIKTLSAELAAGSEPGTSLLTVKVTEADSLRSEIVGNNGRSPSVGSFRRGASLRTGNLLGFGDSLSFSYSNTDGSNAIDVGYSIPINPRNGTISLSYGNTSSEVIEEPFNILDIQSSSRYFDLTYRQPIVQTPSEEFALGLTASRRESDTSLLGMPFELSAGADPEGRTRVSALRFFQEWTKRGSRQVISARSQFSLGVGLFDATINTNEEPDSRFFSWRGQAQWVRLLARDTLFLVRADVQLSDRELMPIEQFGLGGQESVRGYRQDTLLSDNGALLTAELRYPILRVPEWNNGVLQIIPFIDLGKSWNTGREDPSPSGLSSIGLGLQWQQGDDFSVRLDYGIPLVNVQSSERTWQENGLYFSVRWSPF